MTVRCRVPAPFKSVSRFSNADLLERVASFSAELNHCVGEVIVYFLPQKPFVKSSVLLLSGDGDRPIDESLRRVLP